MATKDDVIAQLKKVNDPELGVDIWSLGLVYDVKVQGETVEVLMTFTSPMCPVGPQILSDAKNRLSSVKGVKDVKIEITFDPMWTPEKISADVKAALGIST